MLLFLNVVIAYNGFRKYWCHKIFCWMYLYNPPKRCLIAESNYLLTEWCFVKINYRSEIMITYDCYMSIAVHQTSCLGSLVCTINDDVLKYISTSHINKQKNLSNYMLHLHFFLSFFFFWLKNLLLILYVYYNTICWEVIFGLFNWIKNLF